MGLADAIAAEFQQPTRTCQVRRIIATLNDDDRVALVAAIGQVREFRRSGIAPNHMTPLTAASLHRALIAEGHNVGTDAMERHVAGTCVCGVNG